MRSDIKQRGLGWALMKLIIDYARRTGLPLIHGQVLAENARMLEMCRALGFAVADCPEEPGLRVVTLALA